MGLTPLTLAHSPDPDDVFMWWPITGMIDPRDHTRITKPPVLDTGRFTFRALPADIDVLNRRAIETGDLDITALSIFAWAGVAGRYALTSCGGSFGEGYGPKLVAPAPLPANPLIAIPGARTTAFLLLSLALRDSGTPFRTLELPFDQILRAVADRRADAGLLIHQSQLTYADLGLTELLDLGSWWLDRTGLPLPLGGNALRRDLEHLHGPGTLRELTTLLDRSIRFALQHRDESTDYAMRFAPEISHAQADRYIDMYVSPLTLDAGAAPEGRGQAAIQRLLNDAAALGFCPPVGPIDLIRPA